MKLCTSLLLFLAACSSFGGTADDGASTPGSPDMDGGSSSGKEGGVTGVAPGEIEIAPIPDRAFVVQGSSLDVPIHLVRGAMASDAVDISVTGAPAGVTIRSITIAADSSDGTLSVMTTGDAKQASLDLTISAKRTSADGAEGKLPVFVRGAPGTLDTTFAPDPLTIAVAANDSTQGTLTALSDGGMIVAGTVGTGARLVKVDVEGKSVANTNLGAGQFVAPLPDGRVLSFGKGTIERFSDKLVLDSTFGTAGSVSMGGGTVEDVRVSNGNVLVLSERVVSLQGGLYHSYYADVNRWSADGIRDTAYPTCSLACYTDYALRFGAHALAVDDNGQGRAVVTCDGENVENFVLGCGVSGGRNLGADQGQTGVLMIPGAPYPTIARDGAGGLYVAGWYSQTTLLNVSAAGTANGPLMTTDLFGSRPALSTQSDRSVIVANGVGPDRLLALRRFKPDGTEDASFTHAEAGAGVKFPYDVIIQKDGRIVVLTSSSGQMVLLRFWG